MIGVPAILLVDLIIVFKTKSMGKKIQNYFDCLVVGLFVWKGGLFSQNIRKQHKKKKG